MKFLKIIIFLAIFIPFIQVFSGCQDDSFLEAINEEEDFIAPYDVIIPDSDLIITTYFNIADTGYPDGLYPGDDGSYQDVPYKRSFTPKHNTETGGYIVEDNVTGFTWTKCTADGVNSMKSTEDCSGSTAVEMSRSDAVATCQSLNSLNSNAGYAGYNDWRLPSLAELFTLVDFGNTPYVDETFFPDTVTDSAGLGHYPAYWTSKLKLYYAAGSTTILNEYGWVVYFNGGGAWGLKLTDFVELINVNTGAIANQGFVRCVRGGNN